jgi:peptidyl-prolyl cis-trans isomerase C
VSNASYRAMIVVLAILVVMPLAAQQGPGTVVVTVNDQPIYSWEISLVVPQVQQELARRGENPERETVIKAATQQVINVRLLAQEARRRGLKPNDQSVAETMAQIEEQAGGREGLDAALAELGASYEQLVANVAETDIVQVFVDTQIEPDIEVTAEDVETFYAENPSLFEQPETVHARHILILADQQATEAERGAAQARAAAARKRALEGEDFAGLAIELSEGPSAPDGGDLGFFAREQMVKPFADTAFSLEVGSISQVVETQFGYHVIKVEEKRPASTMTLDEVREPLEKMLRETRGGESIAQLIDQLTAKASIVGVEAPPAAPSGVAVGSGGSDGGGR